MLRRTSLALLAVPALALPVLAVPPATAAPATRVVHVFPTDALTVPDVAQLTGRRVALPRPDCAQRLTDCRTVRLLNQLDGFDLDPRLAVTFDDAVDAYAVAAAMRVRRADGGFSTGVDRVVHDPETHTVYAHPQRQLAPGTEHVLEVQAGRGVPGARSTFTTLSATDGLLDMRRQLDSGAAYEAAGLEPGGDRKLEVQAVVPAEGTTISYVRDLGDEGGTEEVPVPDVSSTGAGSYVFGSFRAPQWINRKSFIPQVPSGTDGPEVVRAKRLGFVMVLPAGAEPEGGWPVAVFGHGFTRSKADLFLAASQNAARGLATVATDVVGHGYGSDSRWRITTVEGTTELPAYGRGVDLDANGTITSTEGSSTALQPARHAMIRNRDALRQTAADVSALVRAVGRGLDADRDGERDVRRDGAAYYGQSFGGIYGTLVGGVDPRLQTVGLNVPGGPISEIVRLSPVFRPLAGQELALTQPSLLNGGDAGFTESLPLAGERLESDPAPGAVAIQQFLADQTWLARAGSPEAYAPLVARKDVLVQAALGDQTVPNPTTSTLVRAGGLQDRTSLFRNDLVEETAADNPHGFLLNPVGFPAGFALGNTQMSTFLATGEIVDPDGPAPVFEAPVADPTLLMRLNYPPAP